VSLNTSKRPSFNISNKDRRRPSFSCHPLVAPLPRSPPSQFGMTASSRVRVVSRRMRTRRFYSVHPSGTMFLTAGWCDP
jgi:hypothetical protein